MQTSKTDNSFSKNSSYLSKIAHLKEENKELRHKSRKLTKDSKRFRESRDAWKAKAKSRLYSQKLLEKRIQRLCEGKKAKHHSYDLGLVTLCVQLRILCNCSYESIRKILVLLSFYLFSKRLSLAELPCRQSIENWVQKSGYYALCGSGSASTAPVCVIIDESIRVGTERLLLALSCPAFKVAEGSLKFADVDIIYAEGSDSWQGTDIAQVLASCISSKGLDVSYILSDEGNNLKKASSCLEKVHIPDISHAMGTCLRRVFEKDTQYKALTSCISKIQAKLAMGEDAYLRPPSIGSKARFMNQDKLLDWAKTILQKFESFRPEAQEKLRPLFTHQDIISVLQDCLEIAQTVKKRLKNKGINTEQLDQIKAYLREERQEKQKAFVTQVSSYIQKYEQAIKVLHTEKPLQACSDIIESVFSIYKNKVSPNYFVGTTALRFELALLNLQEKQIEDTVVQALEQVKVSQIKAKNKMQNTDNQALKRRKLLEI